MAVRLAEPLIPPPGAAPPHVMEKFVIDGGVPLRGIVTPAGNKNAALPILAASVLTADEVLVRNVPRIRDVEAMLGVLRGLGATAEWRDENVVAICAAGVDREAQVDREHAERIRASFLLAGPLLARFGHADMPPPGGDVIGRRRLDPHLDAFRALGASFEHGRDIVLAAPSGGLRAGEVFMDEPSVMGTENALMAAALTPGETRISNAACEPHVVDLARMLVKMGADIRGIGSNVLHVTGAAELGGARDVQHVGPDAADVGAHLDQHAGEVDDVRLAGGVADERLAGRQRRGQQRVLGAHHRRLVHEHLAGAQAAGQHEARGVVALDDGAERLERVEVRVQPAAADHVAAGGRHVGAAEARQQRAGQQERGADPRRELGIDVRVGGDAGGADGDLVLAAPLDARAEMLEQVEHRLHVADPRHVAHDDLVRGERGRGQTGKGGVLVACGHDRARQRNTAVDEELLHAIEAPARASDDSP